VSDGHDEGDELAATLAALDGSVALTGIGRVGRQAADRVAVAGVVARAAGIPRDARAALVAVDPADPSPAVAFARRCPPATLVVFVAAVPGRVDGGTRAALATLRDAGDAVVLAADDGDPVAGTAAALDALVRLVARTDAVNVDLADAETVLSAGGYAAVATGADPDPEAAVEAALAATGPVSLDRATGAVVHLDGGGLSVGAAGAAVDAVRERLADGAHVVWGAATDAGGEEADGAEGERAVTARLVLAGVVPVRPPATAGEPCPRCGSDLVGYRLGDRETVACDDCGFADVGAPLGGDPLVPGGAGQSGSGS
jgi:hypothetical protein